MAAPLIREKVRINGRLAGKANETCYSCDCYKTDKQGDYVFRYGVSKPDGSTKWKNGVFCGLNCYRAYHC